MKNDTNCLVDVLDAKNLDFLIYESKATLRDLLKIVSLRWIKSNLNLINNLIKDADEIAKRAEMSFIRVSTPKNKLKEHYKYNGFNSVVGGPATIN